MLLTLKPDHKNHIIFLTEQTAQVLQDFCKLAADCLQRGPNIKVYNAAAQKLQVDVSVIRNSVEGLVYLLLESCKYKLSSEDFRDSVIALGFLDEKEAILSRFYDSKKQDVSDTFKDIGFKLPEYHDLEWRVEVQIASRSLLKQVAPLITFDLSMRNEESKIEHRLLQTDPVNLLHMAQELEEVLQEGHSQHIRRISRAIK